MPSCHKSLVPVYNEIFYWMFWQQQNVDKEITYRVYHYHTFHIYGGVILLLTHWARDKIRRHFADDIFKCIFLDANIWISIKIPPKFVPKGPINNIAALVQIMACLNQWCLVYWRVYASLGLNEFCQRLGHGWVITAQCVLCVVITYSYPNLNSGLTRLEGQKSIKWIVE